MCREAFCKDSDQLYRHQPGYPRGSPKPNQAYFRGVRRATTGELTRSHTARTKSGHEASFHLPTIVKRLIEACPDALLERNAEDETPFQARLTTISQARNRGEHGREEQGRPGISKSEAERAAQYERERREMIESDEILSYMREYITDNFDRRRAMKALYKVGDGKARPPSQL